MVFYIKLVQLYDLFSKFITLILRKLNIRISDVATLILRNCGDTVFLISKLIIKV